MKRVNVLLYLAAIWLFGMGYLTHRVVGSTSDINSRVYQENDSLKATIVSKDSLINEILIERDFFENQTDEMSDELSFKESEISYWGRKHDSIRTELNKLKRK